MSTHRRRPGRCAARRSRADERQGSRAAEEGGRASAEIDLERTTIRSPVDGVVVGRNVSEGQTVAASLEAPTLFTIAGDLQQMEIHARVDEADIGSIEVGQRARSASTPTPAQPSRPW
jgi:HlyD family secretion protein